MTDKKAFQQKMKAQLDEWSADIDKLKAKASKLTADTKLKSDKQIEILKTKVDEGKKKLSQLEGASEEEWHTIKKTIDNVWNNLKDSVHEAYNKVKK